MRCYEVQDRYVDDQMVNVCFVEGNELIQVQIVVENFVLVLEEMEEVKGFKWEIFEEKGSKRL